MEENQQKNSTLKRVLLLIGGLLVIAALAIGVVALLRTLFAPTPPHAETSAASVNDVINGIKTTGNIKAFENYQEQVTDAPNGRVIATLDGKNYTISTPTKHSLLFFAKTPGIQNDSTAVEQQVSAYMIGKGYEKTENTGSAKQSENPHYTSYQGDMGTCQLVSAQSATPEGLAYHIISCSENSAIAQEYSAIESLLALYRKEQGPPTFTEASRITITEENKMLSFLTLNSERSTMLLFAAIDNNWEYIGNVGGDINSNGKYAISDDVRSKIDDTRWGSFLKKNLQ